MDEIWVYSIPRDATSRSAFVKEETVQILAEEDALEFIYYFKEKQ